MKVRGLRRYFKNLNKKKLPEHLNFSGSADSWFDLYHLHVDNKGLGNRSWKARKQHLETLFELADEIQIKLNQFPKEFQFWIQVDEENSYGDAIYIHTENPNNSNFPIKLDFDSKAEIKKSQLLDFLKEKDYEIQKMTLSDYDGKESTTFFLFKSEFGLKIK